MKNITKIFVAALSVVFCVAVGRLIIDNKNQLLAEGEPTIYTITLDSTNKYSGFPTNYGQNKAYTPSRFVAWSFNGECSSPGNDGHIRYNFPYAGWQNFHNTGVNSTSGGIKGIQSLTIDFAITGTLDNIKMFYSTQPSPTAGDYINFLQSGITSPVVLGPNGEFANYQSNFYLRFYMLGQNHAAATFTIKSLVITYTCQA